MHLSASRRSKLSSLVAGALVVATATACSDVSTGPRGPSFNVTPPGPTQSKICKYGPLGTYTFTITSNGAMSGTLLVSNPFTVSVVDEHGTCVFIHQSGAVMDNFVVTETVPQGMSVERILRGTFGDGCLTNSSLCEVEFTGTNQVSFSPTATTGYYAYFYNAYDDTPPPPAGQGCTPGYWKNHLGSWTGYSPSSDFDATFGVNLFSPNISLLQALNLGGGGHERIARHATAALLNSTNSGVSSSATTAEVIAMVQAVAVSRDFEGTGDILEAMNEQGCPLN